MTNNNWPFIQTAKVKHGREEESMFQRKRFFSTTMDCLLHVNYLGQLRQGQICCFTLRHIVKVLSEKYIHVYPEKYYIVFYLENQRK